MTFQCKHKIFSFTDSSLEIRGYALKLWVMKIRSFRRVCLELDPIRGYQGGLVVLKCKVALLCPSKIKPLLSAFCCGKCRPNAFGLVQANGISYSISPPPQFVHASAPRPGIFTVPKDFTHYSVRRVSFHRKTTSADSPRYHRQSITEACYD